MTASDLAVVVPCFNEAAVIGKTVALLRDWFPSATIVVVDDGSADGTWRQVGLAAAAHPEVRTLRLPANAGKGGAVAAAAPMVSDRGAVLVVDADLTFSRATMTRAVEALQTVDVAIGNRRHPDSTYTVPVQHFGFLYRRHVIGWAFNLFVRLCLGLPHRDTQCGLKAFRGQAFRDVMQRLTTTGFAFDLDVLLLARGLGLRVGEVAVALDVESGPGGLRLVRDGAVALKELAPRTARRVSGGDGRYASATGPER